MKTTFNFNCSCTMPDGVSFDVAGEGTVEMSEQELAVILPAQHNMVRLCLDYFSSLLEKYVKRDTGSPYHHSFAPKQ